MSFRRKYKQVIISFLPILIVFLVSRYFTYIDLFELYWWLSPFMHAVGGGVTSWTVYLLYNVVFKGESFIGSEFLFALSLVSTVVLIGVLWEFYEFLSDMYFATNYLGDVYDTLLDLFMDLVGSVLFILYLVKIKGLNLTNP